MRIQGLIPGAVAALLIAGCGSGNLILNVDVLSYLDPSATQMSFGPVPPLPTGFQSGEVAVVDDSEVNLLEGTSSVASVDEVSIRMRVISSCSSGSGADTLRVYLGDNDQDPMAAGPVLTLPIVFTASVTDTLEVETTGDARVADLFTGSSLRVTVTNALHGPSFGDALTSEVRVVALDATLIAGRKL